MSATTNRRGILGLFVAAPIAAAANAAPLVGGALGRLRPGFTGDFRKMRYADLARLGEAIGAEGLAPTDEALTDLALALDTEPRATAPIARLGPDLSAERPATTEARAIAALAVVFPPEIAAYRSFAPHLRRRLYAELLTREARRAATCGPPPPPPQPGTGA